MEKTNKMKSLTNDMKTFEKLMQEQRNPDCTAHCYMIFKIRISRNKL